MNVVKPIYEYLLWDNCTNHCQFCFLKQNQLFNEEQKIRSLECVLDLLKTDFEKGSHVLLVGGELYDINTLKLQEKFKTIHYQLTNWLFSGYIDLLYINTNLIYSDLSLLQDLLSWISLYKLFDKLKFTTSYDLVGRFRTKKWEELFLDNLKILKTVYPDIKIVVNMILTKDLCKAINEGTFNISAFMKEYDCYVNLLPYIVFDKSLMASRNDIFKALEKMESVSSGYLKDYVLNMNLNQERRMYKFNGEKYEFCSSGYSSCGHPVNFTRYTDKNSCFICDLNKIFGVYL